MGNPEVTVSHYLGNIRACEDANLAAQLARATANLFYPLSGESEQADVGGRLLSVHNLMCRIMKTEPMSESVVTARLASLMISNFSVTSRLDVATYLVKLLLADIADELHTKFARMGLTYVP